MNGSRSAKCGPWLGVIVLGLFVNSAMLHSAGSEEASQPKLIGAVAKVVSYLLSYPETARLAFTSLDGHDIVEIHTPDPSELWAVAPAGEPTSEDDVQCVFVLLKRQANDAEYRRRNIFDFTKITRQYETYKWPDTGLTDVRFLGAPGAWRDADTGKDIAYNNPSFIGPGGFAVANLAPNHIVQLFASMEFIQARCKPFEAAPY